MTQYAYAFVNGSPRETVTYPDGGTRRTDYFRDGRIESVTGSAVTPVGYEYGVKQEENFWREFSKESKLDINGAATPEWRETYHDGAGNVYKSVFPDAAFSQLWFDNKGRLWKERDADGVITLFQYNAEGELEFSALDLNRNDTIDFSGADRITQSLRDYSTRSGKDVRRTLTYVWDTNGQNSKILAGTLEVSVDSLDTWSIIDEAVDHTGTEYDSANGLRTVTQTASNGAVTQSVFLYGRLASITQLDAGSQQIGQVTFQYDTHGRQKFEADARNGTTTYGYNNAVTTVTTPIPKPGLSAQTTTTAYDISLRPFEIIQPDGTFTYFEYHPTGLLKKTWGSRTYPVEYTHDPQGRMKTMKTWQDHSGDSGTAITTWNYHPQRGWLTSKDYPNPGTGAPPSTPGTTGPVYTYTPAGRLESRAWKRTIPSSSTPIVTTYAYNDAGDLWTVTYNDGTPGLTQTYDRRGRLRTGTRNSITITTTLSYNNAGQLTNEQHGGGIIDGLSVEQIYDQHLRLTNSIARRAANILASSVFGYDQASRLGTVTSGSLSATYQYLENSHLVEEIEFRQSSTVCMSTTREHDKINRLTAISSVSSSSGRSSRVYQYNNANQRTRITSEDNSYWDFQYDSLGQLISGKRYFRRWPVPGSQAFVTKPAAGQHFAYDHDNIGNRTATWSGGDQTGANLRAAGYTANRLNEYENRGVPGYVQVFGIAHGRADVTVNSSTDVFRWNEYFHRELAVDNSSAPQYPQITISASLAGNQTNAPVGNVFLPAATESYDHDADGNFIQDGRWNYTWHAENRLIKMEAHVSGVPPAKVEFEYDWRGRRIGKKVWNGQTLELERKFLYDDWNLAAELDGNNNTVQTYIWGSDLSGTPQGAGGVGGLLMIQPNGANTMFVAYDGNGNVTGLTNRRCAILFSI